MPGRSLGTNGAPGDRVLSVETRVFRLRSGRGKGKAEGGMASIREGIRKISPANRRNFASSSLSEPGLAGYTGRRRFCIGGGKKGAKVTKDLAGGSII